MATTSIEWTNRTWNPVTGCSRVSPGCDHCYAEAMARRLQAMGSPRYANGFAVTLHDALDLPLRWRTPSRIFVNSMSDLFHSQVPDAFLVRVFAVMRQAHWHTFQILTKRPGRLRRLAGTLDWPPNVWVGVSIELDQFVARADALRMVPTPVRFLSCEPLLGPLPSLNLDSIAWVLIGGESGPHARPMALSWVRDLIGRCQEQGVAVFVKQMGTAWARQHGQRGKGSDMTSWDADLRVREYPTPLCRCSQSAQP
jgi:protein gp37